MPDTISPSSEGHTIEDIILSYGSRGMERVRGALPADYCSRAARLILGNPGRVLIGTGFPVGGSFETDGPIGAIALYRVLERLGYEPIFGCAPPISRVLGDDFRTLEIPILSWPATVAIVDHALADIRPALIVSIERPGVARDGRYYNMRGKDISDSLAKFDLFFNRCECATIAVGDGGNEIGMGNIYAEVSQLDIIPSVTTCDELVIATVSNWGVYGMIAAMSCELRQDLFRLIDAVEIVRHLVDRGAVDGKTGYAECSEDGFPLAVGLSIIERLRDLAAKCSRKSGSDGQGR
jgi:hypothetical protein